MSKDAPTLLSIGQDLKALTGILNAVFTEKAKAEGVEAVDLLFQADWGHVGQS